MPDVKYKPEEHGDLVIAESNNEELKNAFIYYLASEICTPKFTMVYDYSRTYEQLKQRIMPKSINSNYNDLRISWVNQVFTWLKELYPEVIKFCYQAIAQQELPTTRLEEIERNLTDRNSDLYKKLYDIAQYFKDRSLTLTGVKNLSQANNIYINQLRDLLINDFLIDFFTHNSNDYHLNLDRAIDLIIKLYNENNEKWLNTYPLFWQFVNEITNDLAGQSLVSTQNSRHTLAKIKKQHVGLNFSFTHVNRIRWGNATLQPANLTTAIENDLDNNYNKNSTTHWTNNLSDNTSELIKLYGLYHAVVNKLMPKYQAFTQAQNIRRKQALALELYKELKPLFSQFDALIDRVITKFAELLIEKRNLVSKQLPVLIYDANELDNYSTILRTGFQFEINDFKELMASMQLTIRSFRRLYKSYFREAYFYPYFTMKDIVALKEPSSQLSLIENTIYLPKTATFNYHLKGFGVVPVNYTLGLTGVIDPYEPDFGKYLNDIKPFEKLEPSGFTHQEFFKWLKYTYQVKPERVELERYTDSFSQQQMLMQRLAIFAICLFIVEGIRNPGSVITNLLNLHYLSNNQPQEEVPSSLGFKLTKYFPMTESDAANTGRSLAHQSSPQHNSPLGTKESNSNIAILMGKQNKTLKCIKPKYATFQEVTLFAGKKITMLSKEEEQNKLKAIYERGLADLETALTQENEGIDLIESNAYLNLCQAIDKLQKKDESKKYYNSLSLQASGLQNRVNNTDLINGL